jgi:hypothetical protein
VEQALSHNSGVEHSVSMRPRQGELE